MGPFAGTLAAISMGAVYMGALTYIGNAPNFMVYAIATERGVKMPSFFGYLLWASLLLVPIFVLLTLLPVAPRAALPLTCRGCVPEFRPVGDGGRDPSPRRR